MNVSWHIDMFDHKIMPSARAIGFFAALLVLLSPARVKAWCLMEQAGGYPMFWREKFEDWRIKVFLSLGPDTSFIHTGLSLTQAEALVQRVLAVHNETIGPPYLVYAGTTTAERDDKGTVKDRPPGIVVESFSCGPTPCSQESASACANITGSLAENLVSKGWVTLRPSVQLCPESGEDWSIESVFGVDPALTLLHELGHTLGLDHSDLPQEECAGQWDGPAGAAVMHHIVTAPSATRRDWRRDDIQGIRQIWGATIEHAVYSWQDTAFPGAPPEAGRTALCADMRTPPAITSAVASDAATDTQFVAFTDADDRVAHLQWNGAHFAAPDIGAVVDPSELGISFAPVGIAHSDSGNGTPRRVLVIWAAQETPTDSTVLLRWALRDIDGGAWTYGSLDPPSAPQRSKDVAVGFDPGNSLFIVSSITRDMNPYFVTLDMQGNSLDTLVLGGLNEPPFVFDVGKASCFPEGGVSRCVVPYISSELDVMVPEDRILRSGWYNLAVQPDGTMALTLDARVSDFPPRGMVDLSAAPDGFRGVVGDRRHTLERAPGIGAADTPALDTEMFPSADWPIRLGSQSSASSEATTRLAARRLGKLCGNGELDCDEACDDGNSMDADGCSASCVAESSPTTGNETTGLTTDTEGTATVGITTAGPATATDTGPVTDDDGCGCATRGRRPVAFLVVMLLAGRRRRAPASVQQRLAG